MKLLGPPPINMFAAGLAGLVGLYGMFVVPTDQFLIASVMMLGSALVVWRLLSHSVSVVDGQVVVRNLLKNHHLPSASVHVIQGRSQIEKAGIWLGDLHGSGNVIRVGCSVGRSSALVSSARSRLAWAIEQSATQQVNESEAPKTAPNRLAAELA